MGNVLGTQSEKKNKISEPNQMFLQSELVIQPDSLNQKHIFRQQNMKGSNRNEKFVRQKQQPHRNIRKKRQNQQKQSQEKYESKSSSDFKAIQQLFRKYTINTRMQAKQQSIQLACPQIEDHNNYDELKQIAKKELKKWLAQTSKSVFSIAFEHYKKGQMSEQQMKIYCSQNLLLNLIKLSKQNNLTKKDYKYLDSVLKDDILSYYKKKYPPTLEKQVYKRFRAQIEQIDAMEDFQQELIKISNLQKQFEQRYRQYIENENSNPQYYDLMMRFINNCLELPDQKRKQVNKLNQPNEKSHFEEFQELMATIFNKVEKIYYMKKIAVPEMAAKTQLQNKEEQEYRQKVKKYTKYKIGRKIPEYAHKFTDQEIKDKNISIKDPAVLRFLTKWLEQLQQTLENIQSKLTSVGKKLNEKNGNNYEYIRNIKEQRKKLLDIIQDKIYQQQEFCNYSYLDKKQIDEVPINEKLVGVFSCVASQNLSIYITKSINSIIHDLCQLSYDDNVGQQFLFPSITCKVGDLMRCKCSSREEQILNIYKQIKEYSRKNPQTFKIARTKNRLQKGTKDILINVFFNSTILCQIQLSINPSQASENTLNSFNHYLYELQRSRFGPINQLASIWSKDQRFEHIMQLLEKKWKKSAQTKCNCKKMETQEEKHPFICSVCDRYYGRKLSFVPHARCKSCKFWKCSNCQFEDIINDKNGIKQLIKEYSQKDQCQLLNLKEQIVLPQYGMYISKVDKAKQFIEFKTFDLPDQKHFYLIKNQGKGKKIIHKIEKDEQKKLKEFFAGNIVFKIKEIKQLSKFKQQLFKKTLLLPKNTKQIYKKQGDTLKLALNNLTIQQFDQITKGDQKSCQRIKSINLSLNDIQEFSSIANHFKKVQTLNLNFDKITEIPNNIGNLEKLNKLNLRDNYITSIPKQIGKLNNLLKLDLSQNKYKFTLPAQIGNLSKLSSLNLAETQLIYLPKQIGNLKNLSQLQLNGNQITQLPKQIGNLNKLSILNLSQNQLTSLPKQIGNLENLQVLYLWENQLTSLPKQIGNLANLSELYLSTNKLTYLPKQIGNLTQLSDLDLNQNQLTQLPKQVGNLTKLSSLLLADNRISINRDFLERFQTMNLILVDLRGNKIQLSEQDKKWVNNLDHKIKIQGSDYIDQ